MVMDASWTYYDAEPINPATSGLPSSLSGFSVMASAVAPDKACDFLRPPAVCVWGLAVRLPPFLAVRMGGILRSVECRSWYVGMMEAV